MATPEITLAKNSDKLQDVICAMNEMNNIKNDIIMFKHKIFVEHNIHIIVEIMSIDFLSQSSWESLATKKRIFDKIKKQINNIINLLSNLNKNNNNICKNIPFEDNITIDIDYSIVTIRFAV